MNRELEILGAASAGGWLRWRKQHALPAGTPCASCETPLMGLYCYTCGQLAESYHKSIWHLLVEAMESFFHLDGRLVHTIPALFVRPARLTRDYLDGKRAFQIPPLRLFLVVLLLVFFFGSLSGQEAIRIDVKKDPHTVEALEKGMPPETKSPLTLDALAKAKAKDTPVDTAFRKAAAWTGPRLRLVLANPAQFKMIMESWAHRMAVAMLPLSALILSALFVFQRRFFVFDHLIFSMHSLSFVGLLLTLAYALRPLIGPVSGIVLLAAPVHLFVHMRGVYATSIFGTLTRMLLLFVASIFSFAILLATVTFIALNAMGDH